jgi:hypothetical protein
MAGLPTSVLTGGLELLGEKFNRGAPKCLQGIFKKTSLEALLIAAKREERN